MCRHIISLLFTIILISCTSIEYEEVVEVYPNGQTKLLKSYLDKEKTKLYKEVHFYEDGKMKMLGFWEKEKRDGKWQYWYPNGKIWSEAEYKAGLENGLKTVYYENGSKYYEGNMTNGERNGKWNFWDKEGEKIKTLDYPE